MVNTFLVDTDFVVSASKLDSRRLGKQRVEAYQILIALTQLRFLATFLGIPDYSIDVDTPKEQREKWIRSVISAFKLSGLASIHIRQNILVLYHAGQVLPRKPTSGNKIFYDSVTGIVQEIKGKKVVSTGPWWQYVLPDESLITMGFKLHPAVCMWLGFETALKAYINAHIQVWKNRGNVNNMIMYSIGDYKRPSWTYNQKVIKNFKSTLVQREIERLESAWYLRQPDFVETWASTSTNSAMVNNAISRLPELEWFKYINQQYMLLLGQFPGFIWP